MAFLFPCDPTSRLCHDFHPNPFSNLPFLCHHQPQYNSLGPPPRPSVWPADSYFVLLQSNPHPGTREILTKRKNRIVSPFCLKLPSDVPQGTKPQLLTLTSRPHAPWPRLPCDHTASSAFFTPGPAAPGPLHRLRPRPGVSLPFLLSGSYHECLWIPCTVGHPHSAPTHLGIP